MALIEAKVEKLASMEEQLAALRKAMAENMQAFQTIPVGTELPSNCDYILTGVGGGGA